MSRAARHRRPTDRPYRRTSRTGAEGPVTSCHETGLASGVVQAGSARRVAVAAGRAVCLGTLGPRLPRQFTKRNSSGPAAEKSGQKREFVGVYSNGTGSPHCSVCSATQTFRPSNWPRICSRTTRSLSVLNASGSNRNAHSSSLAIGATRRSPSYPANLNAPASAIRWADVEHVGQGTSTRVSRHPQFGYGSCRVVPLEFATQLAWGLSSAQRDSSSRLRSSDLHMTAAHAADDYQHSPRGTGHLTRSEPWRAFGSPGEYGQPPASRADRIGRLPWGGCI